MPDAAATEAVIAARIFATLTASAPAPSPIATVTPVPPTVSPPTSTAVPGPALAPPTLTPTASPPTPLLNKIAIAKAIPTPPPAPTTPPAPAGSKRDLSVSFINPHYDCEQDELSYRGSDGDLYPIWGYRYFQIDMFIKNNGAEPVVPSWRVRRWIITDGMTDSVSDLVWEWSGRNGTCAQPTIQPGQSAG